MTQRDPYPLPPKSIGLSLQHKFNPVQPSQSRRDPRELVVTIVLSLLFIVPLVCIAVIYHFQ